MCGKNLPFCFETDIYRQFQHDLYRLRLEAARGYAGVLQKGLSPVSASSEEPVKLHVEVSYRSPVVSDVLSLSSCFVVKTGDVRLLSLNSVVF